MRAQSRNFQHGFTLVEMSIVLVVIALLVGGVMVGQSMIRTAAVQAIPAEKEAYATAIRTFKDRYQFYPGDFPKAIETWGALAADCESSATAGTPLSTATCNGNGDGLIGGMDSRSATNDGFHEMFRAWQHLYNAKLVEDFYDGAYFVSADTTALATGPLRHQFSAAQFGVNAPLSKFSDQSGWNMSTLHGGLERTCDADYETGTIAGNALVFASHISGIYPFNIGMSDGTAKLLSAEEAKGLDLKIDDGLPLTGAVRGIGAGDLTVVGTCFSDTCTAGQDYGVGPSLDTSGNASTSCGLAFMNSY